MPESPIFMRLTPAISTERTLPGKPAPVVTLRSTPAAGTLHAVAATPTARVLTIKSRERKTEPSVPLELSNPAMAKKIGKIQFSSLDLIAPALEGDTRDKLTVPVSPIAEPADTTIFEDPADPAKKYYLPRYRVRIHSGHYEIGFNAMPEGTWRLNIGLEPYPAPELGLGIQGVFELPHDIAVFFRYAAGPSHTIGRTVNFSEIIKDDKGLKVAAILTVPERDALLFALQTPAALPALVTRRAIRVAIPIANPSTQPNAPGRVRDHRSLAQNAALAARFIRIRPNPQPQPKPAGRYSTVQRALDDMTDPEPFVLDPLLHPYLYESAAAGGRSGEAEFRRVILTYPKDTPDARFYTYLQDMVEPWIFYYLPDRFKLSRREQLPFLPQMVVRLGTADGEIEKTMVSVDYLAEPWLNTARLKAAGLSLQSEIPVTARQSNAELRPLQAKASLRMWLPGPGGAALVEQKDVTVDLANGFVHSLTLPLDSFRQLYAAAYSSDATSLFSGEMQVETGLSTPESIHVGIRFSDTQGEILTFEEQPFDSGDTIAVKMLNGTESPLHIDSLPVSVRRGETEVPATIEGLTFVPALELESGTEVKFFVRPQSTLPGDGTLDAVFDTSGVKIRPDPEKILPLISDTSVPAEYERQIEVMTVPELLGEADDPASIILINVEFKGGNSLKLSRSQLSGIVQVRLPLMDLLLNRDVQGKYHYRQQIIRRNGTQTADTTWREADFGILVVPGL